MDDPDAPQRYQVDEADSHDSTAGGGSGQAPLEQGFNSISLSDTEGDLAGSTIDGSAYVSKARADGGDDDGYGDPTPRLRDVEDMGILSEPVRYHHHDDDGSARDGYGAQRGMPSRTEAERAGLDYVDVTLDAGGRAGLGEGDLGAPGSPYLASSPRRSAADISKDSISSGSKMAKQLAKQEKRRLKEEEGERKRRGSQASSSKTETTTTAASHSVAGSRRGSEAPSIASTAQGSSLASPAPAAARALVSEDEAVGITVGGENGEVEVVRLESPKTLIHKRLPEAAPIAIPQKREVEEGVEEAKSEGVEEQSEQDGKADEAQAVATGAAATAAAAVTGASADGSDASTAPPEEAADGDRAPKLDDVQVGDGGLRDIADSPSKEKKSKSSGPSAFERYMSRTRMMTLPPKPRQEDDKHLSDFAEMMKQFQEKERKRAEEEEERKRKRDEELEEDMKVWEKEILPSWTRARREGRLKNVWKKGAPPNMRGKVWALACGNAQMLPRNLFHKALKQAKEDEAQGKLPREDLDEMESDIDETLPSLKLFQRDVGPLYDDLRDVLLAFIMVRLEQLRSASQSPGAGATNGLGINASGSNGDSSPSLPPSTRQPPRVYQKGVAALSAMLISNMSPSESLIALLNLIAERPWLKALYAPPTSDGAPTLDPALAYERVFDTLLADQLPKCYANLQARGVQARSYVRHWARTLFVPYLPFDTAARLWDWILLQESDSIMFRSGLAIVNLLSSRLYVPDKAELLSILRGNNRASLQVWYRSQMAVGSPVLPPPPPRLSVGAKSPKLGEGATTPSSPELPHSATTAGTSIPMSSTSTTSSFVPPSSASQHEADPSYVPLDDIYAQYGISQETLFRTLEEQDEWWKDSTLERLLDRELG